MDSLYQAHILEHCKHPHNKHKIEDADDIFRGRNVSCGDDLTWYIKWGEGENADVIQEISFDGYGCAISSAGASMLSDVLKGKSKNEVLSLNKEDMLVLLHVEISNMREKCALLPLTALHAGLLGS